MIQYFLFNIVSCLLVASGLSASVPPASLDHPRLHKRASGPSACAQVAHLSDVWKADPANNDSYTPMPAKLAYDCLTSVPFNQSAALALVNNTKPMLSFQTTTFILKNPPWDWARKVRPGYDLFGELEKVRRKVASGAYANEHQFGMELFQVFQFAHDGHLQCYPDSIGTAFAFRRGAPRLVSVSANGYDLPRVYSFDDVTAESLGGKSFKASPITHIYGQDVQSLLENDSKWDYGTDLDATYNALFASVAGGMSPKGVGYQGNFHTCGDMDAVYPGPTTILRFANGTQRSFENKAYLTVPFDGISDGKTLYQTYYSTPKITSDDDPDSQTSSNSTSSNSTSTTTFPLPPGYPPPIFLESTQNYGGFYLDSFYSDVAVLTVPTFDYSSDTTIVTQDCLAKFVTEAKAAGKKKLIIDLQTNDGGSETLAYNLFKILFPRGRDHSAAMRFHATDASRLLTEKLSKLGDQYPLSYPSPLYENSTIPTNYLVAQEYNYNIMTNTQGQNFKSWKDYFGPRFHNGDQFSSLFRFNLSYSDWTNGMYGYGRYSSYTQQPFQAQDIIILTDGTCASSCSVFVDLMRTIKKVKTIAIGGRARYGPMQTIGGTRGPRVMSWTDLNLMMQLAIQNFSTPEESARSMKTQLATLMDPLASDRSVPGSISNINFADAIRDGDWSNTPLQFTYESVDCHMLFTKGMAVDITAIWKAVADSAWGWKNHCIDGNLQGWGRYWRRELYERELTQHEKELSKRTREWRENLKPEDFAIDTNRRIHQARPRPY
ncbi:hypothetical protein COCMIDRAFT_7254 [Bipolaris oryzae ATCC 44560]|uniref:Uncharacterized protein n=1 Tax=Bipolaris oryzae ATCC 44560 TaxID=930090 RepID=W6Z6U8_COCMI|nr:uncharacterized protein COCMIDRAFT_7254 [Bipolaris oryzae ATCC 44560]EUC43269.1 hypothetical protein COCMIDRAFT_7254 [Bipolaris oryzae ATCC 44560]